MHALSENGRRRLHWLIVGAIALGASAGAAALFWGAWWAWWRLPKRQVDSLRLQIRDPKARADVEDNFRKTIGQVIGGATVLIAAVLGAGFAYLQFSQQSKHLTNCSSATRLERGSNSWVATRRSCGSAASTLWRA
jgi:hypothetical protein